MIQLEEGMLLYHGSYCIVGEPDLHKCAKYKDFGQGFYLTTSKEQATTHKARRRGLVPAAANYGYVSFFKINQVQDLNVFCFETADINWLHCIIVHRKNDVFADFRKQMENYDVISGKIANDDTNTTIMAYMGNVFGEMGSEQADRICINLLIPDRLENQFCFRTDKALSTLEFLKIEKVALE